MSIEVKSPMSVVATFLWIALYAPLALWKLGLSFKPSYYPTTWFRYWQTSFWAAEQSRMGVCPCHCNSSFRP